MGGTWNHGFLIVFTDLDGTLLDHNTYGWRHAAPALERCRRLKVPVVLVSSKTRAEIEHLREELPVDAPFVSENGGGIFVPHGIFDSAPPDAVPHHGLLKVTLGMPYPRVVEGLRDIREELVWDIRGFSDMDLEEISLLTGLSPGACRRAAAREFDEPFLVRVPAPADERLLCETAEKRGYRVSTGGRFYHLQGPHDKGLAMDRIISWYEACHGHVTSVALGDSPNDFAILERADYPVLVRSYRDQRALKMRIPRMEVTHAPGPKGWNSAVLDIVGKGGNDV